MELQEGLEPSQTDLQSVVLPFYHCSEWSGDWGSNPGIGALKAPPLPLGLPPLMVHSIGFEPMTLGLEVRCSSC